MEVSGVDILSSAQKASAGLVVVAMKPYAERDTTIQDIISCSHEALCRT